MIKTVLVPLDGSRFSEQAVPLGLAVARAANAELRFAHVHFPLAFEGLPYAEQDQRWDIQAREQELEYLDEVAERVRGAGHDRVAVELLDGDVVPALLGHARAVGADLVVLSSHGRGGVERAWLGSVADGLVRRSHLPVLLVRPETEEGEPPDLERLPALRHILVPLDGSELAEQVLVPATELGELFDAYYTLLRVMPKSFVPGAAHVARAFDQERVLREEHDRAAAEYLADVETRLEHRGVRVETEVAKGSPATTILDRATALGADAIAIATHGRGAALRALLGSVADKVVRASSIPVLVHRPTHQETR